MGIEGIPGKFDWGEDPLAGRIQRGFERQQDQLAQAWQLPPISRPLVRSAGLSSHDTRTVVPPTIQESQPPPHTVSNGEVVYQSPTNSFFDQGLTVESNGSLFEPLNMIPVPEAEKIPDPDDTQESLIHFGVQSNLLLQVRPPLLKAILEKKAAQPHASSGHEPDFIIQPTFTARIEADDQGNVALRFNYPTSPGKLLGVGVVEEDETNSVRFTPIDWTGGGSVPLPKLSSIKALYLPLSFWPEDELRGASTYDSLVESILDAKKNSDPNSSLDPFVGWQAFNSIHGYEMNHEARFAVTNAINL